MSSPPAQGAAGPVVRPTPPISRGAAELAIAARLTALHHPPDLLEPAAVAALIAHAGGSTRRLRAALASTLFLASTEDAPRIGPALVARALEDATPVRRGATQPASGRPGWARHWRLGAAGAALLLTLFAWQPWRGPAVAPLPHGSPHAPPAPSRTAVTAPAPAPAPAVGTPASTARQPVPPAALRGPPPEPPARFIAAPALPTILPAGPPSTVVLMLPARDPAASSRAAGLARRLRDAGIAQVVVRPGRALNARRPVSYFYADDLALARKASRVLTNEGWPHLARNSLAPRLVLSPIGPASRRPGLVEIELP